MTNKTIEAKAPTEKHIVFFSIPPIVPINSKNDINDITVLIFFILTTPFCFVEYILPHLTTFVNRANTKPCSFLAGFCQEKMEWIK